MYADDQVFGLSIVLKLLQVELGRTALEERANTAITEIVKL